jgi:hypothetical protein
MLRHLYRPGTAEAFCVAGDGKSIRRDRLRSLLIG